MKKYIKSIVLVALILVSLGTYYVYTAYAASGNPDLSIETISGDESLIESLNLRGGYQHESAFESFVLDQSGSTYQSDLNIIEQFDGLYQATKKRLQEEHRGFMRGKNVYDTNVYEDENHVVIVETETESAFNGESSLTASLLDKETGESSDTIVNFSGENVSYMNSVLDIQMADGKIYVFTNVWVNANEYGYPEVHLLEIDPDSEQLTSQKVVLSGDEYKDVDSDVDFSLLGQSVQWAANDFVVFRQNVFVFDEEGRGQEEKDNGLYAYDVQNGEMSQLSLPESIDSLYVDAFDGSNLYYYEESTEGLMVNVFQLGNEEFDEEITLELDGPALTSTMTHDGKLYGIQETNEDIRLYVFDLLDGSKLYEGEIKVSGEADPSNIHMDRIVMK